MIAKVPSAAVLAPVLVPLATTEAAAIGEPSFASNTLPVTVLFCACAFNASKPRNSPTKEDLTIFEKFIIGGLLV